ncbi:hypothetical protein BGZ51_005954 [Haplosporangium sp. Z 767]|nr:hypothetical protein BGZ51_005954 [Haplosporangium sp. Z 767]
MASWELMHHPSLRLLSLLMGPEGKTRLWDTCLEDISMFHGQSHISHILWNHSGNRFASIDEKGKIVIWANKVQIYTEDGAKTGKDHFTWICYSNFLYIASKSDGTTIYERERTGRPRNPLALIVLTSDGQLTTLFKQAGQVFSHISTNLPRRYAGEDLTSSRISHGSMMNSAEGIHLATHTSGVIPSIVNLYQIDLRFTSEVAFQCDALAILHISNPLTGPGSIMTAGVVQHLQLLPPTQSRPYSVAVALAVREGEREFKDKFVTAMSCIPRSRELVIGFSDGSILGLDSRFTGLLDATSTLLDGFQKDKGEYPVVAIYPSPNGLALLCASLNGLIYDIKTSESSGYDLDLEPAIQYALLALLNDWDYSDIVSVIVRASIIAGDKQLPDRFIEGIFKSYDTIRGAEDSSMIEPFLPRASVMGRMLSLQLVLFQAIPDKSVQYRVTSALLHLQSIGEVFSGCCSSDPAALAAHLDQGSNVVTGLKPLAFDTNSLWSLLPLSGWVLDFCTILFRELAVFLNLKTTSKQGSSSVVPQSVPEGQGPVTADATAPVRSILCFFYHNRARKTLRSVLVLLEQFHQYVRNREQLYMRVIQTEGAIKGGGSEQEMSSDHTNTMTILEAVAMKDIHIGTLSQYVEATFSRCAVKIGIATSFLRDLNGIVHHVDPTKANGGSGAFPRQTENGILDKSPSDHAVFIKGVVPSVNSISLSQTKTELRTIIRRYPTLWEMNRLIFTIVHWVDLEPASSLTFPNVSLGQKAAAMHPMRCKIDSTMALKARAPGGLGAGSGRALYSLPQHLPSNVNTSNTSVGPRGSISGVTGKAAVPNKVFAESPGELQLSQQSAQQQSRHSSFAEGSSTMATAGSISQGGQLDTSHALTFGLPPIWGLVDDGSRNLQKNDEESDKDGEIENVRSIWHNWNATLHERLHNREGTIKDSNTEDMVETVPDDDVLLGEVVDGDDEDVESEEDLQNGFAGSTRRDSKGNFVRTGRRSSLATLTPQSLWLLRKSQAISQKTRAHWTEFPVLASVRPYIDADIANSNSRLAPLGLSGHFAPVDLQSTEFQTYSQSDIESQVRKRRFGIDLIRKAKKYKTTGVGRQCIRCLQLSSSNNGNTKPTQRRQLGNLPNTIPDIAAATLWYHNYDRSCICGGIWLEL